MRVPSYLELKRRQLGLTQAELGKQTGIPQATISAWEVGRQKPSSNHLATLAAALLVPLNELKTNIGVTYRVQHGSQEGALDMEISEPDAEFWRGVCALMGRPVCLRALVQLLLERKRTEAK